MNIVEKLHWLETFLKVEWGKFKWNLYEKVNSICFDTQMFVYI